MLNKKIQSKLILFFNNNDIQSLLDLFNQEEANFNSINIATWFNRLGKLVSKKDYYKFKTVLSNAISTLPRYEFNSQEIANSLNALAKWNLDVKKPPYSSAITALIEKIPINIAQFNSQHIANSLNALAKWNIDVKKPPYSSAITALIEKIPINIAQFNSQEIANSLNALAKWNIDVKKPPYSSAITALIEKIPIKIAQFNSQAIANSLNALAKWNIDVKKPPYSSAITSLIEKIPINIAQFNSQHIANSLNALAKWNLDVKQPPYSSAITALIEKIPINIEKFNSQEIANSLNALAKLNLDVKQPPYSSAITALIEKIPINIAQFNSQDIANSLNALAKWNIDVKKPPYSSAITSLIEQIPIKIAKFNSQDIANILLALCIFDLETECIGLWSHFQTNLTQNIEALEELAARQIYQAYLYFHPKNQFMCGVLIDTIQKKFISELKKEKTTISQLQKDVCNYVQRYLINQTSIRTLEEEYFIEYTRVDIALSEKKLVIQVNGPCHYLGDRLNPETRFNNHLLEKLGWSVVTIPYFEWDPLKTHSEKNAYIKEKLKSYNIQDNSEESSLYQTSGTELTMGQYKQAKVKKNRSVYDSCALTDEAGNILQHCQIDFRSRANSSKRATQTQGEATCVMQTSFKNSPLQTFHKPHDAINNRKKPKQQKKRVNPSANIMWDDIIQLNLKEKIRPDELQKAYKIFEFSYQTLIKENKNKKDLDLFKQLIREKLEKATYQKKYELLSYRTIFSFFKGEPCHYGLRFNKKTHPKEAFTENVIKDCVRLLRD